jgi:hypothetical protein
MNDYNGILHMRELSKEQSSDAYQWARAVQAAFFQVCGLTLDFSYLHPVLANVIMSSLDGQYNKIINPLEQELSKTKEQLRTALECLVKMKGYGYDGYFPIDEALEKIGGINIVPDKV